VNHWLKIGSFTVVTGAVVFIDHAGKLLAAHFLAEGVRHSFLADVLRVEPVFNTGAILGLGSQLPDGIRVWLLPVLTAAVLIWVGGMLIREKQFGWAFAGLSLVWAGGFSNLVDRAVYGRVFDFFNVGIGPFRSGTSNLADVAILAGLPLILIGWTRTRTAPAEPEAD
jgi:signal peptidase II